MFISRRNAEWDMLAQIVSVPGEDNMKYKTVMFLLRLFETDRNEARLSKALLAHTHHRMRQLGLPIED